MKTLRAFCLCTVGFVCLFGVLLCAVFNGVECGVASFSRFFSAYIKDGKSVMLVTKTTSIRYKAAKCTEWKNEKRDAGSLRGSLFVFEEEKRKQTRPRKIDRQMNVGLQI